MCLSSPECCPGSSTFHRSFLLCQPRTWTSFILIDGTTVTRVLIMSFMTPHIADVLFLLLKGDWWKTTKLNSRREVPKYCVNCNEIKKKKGFIAAIIREENYEYESVFYNSRSYIRFFQLFWQHSTIVWWKWRHQIIVIFIHTTLWRTSP